MSKDTHIWEKETFRVLAPTVVSVQQVMDTVCAALEGGSTYWCEDFEPERYIEGTEWGHEQVALGVPFKITRDGGEVLRVDNSKAELQTALELLALNYPEVLADITNDNGDADTGDIFFQLLCFGEVEYG